MSLKKILFLAIALLFLALIPGCKKDPTSSTIPPQQATISVSVSPNSAGPDAIITVAIAIAGNDKEVRVFGLDLTFDTNMFQFQEVTKGTLTGNWAAVDGNEVSPGTLKVGGFVGEGSPIAKNSTGTVAEVKFKVTGAAYGNGQQSQVCVGQYTDDLSAFKPDPACATFTLKK
jgi:hypothetical protein